LPAIAEVDFSGGILTLPATVKREMTGDYGLRSGEKLEHRCSGDKRLAIISKSPACFNLNDWAPRTAAFWSASKIFDCIKTGRS
jgi:hypothetical protein